MFRSVRLAVPLTAMLLCGCAAHQFSPPAFGGSRDRLSGEEARARGITNAYAAVITLRPDYLRRRLASQSGRLPVFYIDGLRADGVNALEFVSTTGLLEIRYIGALDASFRFGPGHSAGAVLVTTLHGPGRPEKHVP